jgi:glycosyltransferase involved in cell wall biosynthesis
VEAIDPGVPRADLIRHYEAASILVMPSQYESFGMVASEAMACGCAVVATQTGFPYELKHEEEVLHVPFGDAHALADAVTRLLQDEDLRNRISEAGHRRVQRLTWENAGQSLNAFVARIVEGGVRQA